MHYEESKQVTLAQRCFECRSAFKEDGNRFCCCDRRKSVCDKCLNKRCKQCGKHRQRKVYVTKCSYKSCAKRYDIDDMFFDFKGDYYLCPKCLSKDYRHQYQKVIKTGKIPDQIRLQTGSHHAFKDLVAFFNHWCFCCANRIGENNAFEMKKGARICPSCIALNFEIMSQMIQCISCEGYIRNQKQIFQIMGDQTQVLCVYCAQTQKQELSKLQPQKKQSSQLNSPVLKSKAFSSAFQKSKMNKSNSQQYQPARVVKVSTFHSIDKEAIDVSIEIKKQKSDQKCDNCRCILNKQNIFTMVKSDQGISPSLQKLFKEGKQFINVCLICFGQNFSDKGMTVQFQSQVNRNSFREQDKRNSQKMGEFPGSNTIHRQFSPRSKAQL